MRKAADEREVLRRRRLLRLYFHITLFSAAKQYAVSQFFAGIRLPDIGNALAVYRDAALLDRAASFGFGGDQSRPNQQGEKVDLAVCEIIVR